MKLYKKHIEIEIIKKRLGFMDNAEYQVITIGITIKKEIKK